MNGVIAYALSKIYVDASLDGVGALKGNPCTVKSKTAIEGGTRLVLGWTSNSGIESETVVDIINGVNGRDGTNGQNGNDGKDGLGIKSVTVNEQNHLIVTYDDDTTEDAGVIRGGDGRTSDYSDLENKPSINGVELDGDLSTEDLGIIVPTKTSDLTNDSDFVSETDLDTVLEDKVDKVQGKGLSTNDYDDTEKAKVASAVTNAVNNLVNYYLKSETYSKTEVDNIVDTVKNSRFEVVATLPAQDIETNVIYLVPKDNEETNNVKDEYINLDGTSTGWEKIGDTEIDLSGYVTTTALDTILADYVTSANLTTILSDYALSDDLEELSDRVSDAELDIDVLEGENKESSDAISDIVNVLGAKNLIKFPPYYNGYSRTINGITFTVNDDGSVLANGTNNTSDNAVFNCHGRGNNDDNPEQIIPNGDYIISGSPEGMSGSTFYVRVGITKNGAFESIGRESNNDGRFTINGDDYIDFGAYVSEAIVVVPGTTVNNVLFKPMLRLASIKDDTYVPYAKTNRELTADMENVTKDISVLNDTFSGVKFLQYTLTTATTLHLNLSNGVRAVIYTCGGSISAMTQWIVNVQSSGLVQFKQFDEQSISYTFATSANNKLAITNNSGASCTVMVMLMQGTVTLDE